MATHISLTPGSFDRQSGLCPLHAPLDVFAVHKLPLSVKSHHVHAVRPLDAARDSSDAGVDPQDRTEGTVIVQLANNVANVFVVIRHINEILAPHLDESVCTMDGFRVGVNQSATLVEICSGGRHVFVVAEDAQE